MSLAESQRLIIRAPIPRFWAGLLSICLQAVHWKPATNIEGEHKEKGLLNHRNSMSPSQTPLSLYLPKYGNSALVLMTERGKDLQVCGEGSRLSGSTPSGLS